LTGSEVTTSTGVHTSGKSMGANVEVAILGIEEEKSHWSKMG
jgi:hypothetical protein